MKSCSQVQFVSKRRFNVTLSPSRSYSEPHSRFCPLVRTEVSADDRVRTVFKSKPNVSPPLSVAGNKTVILSIFQQDVINVDLTTALIKLHLLEKEVYS